uniref:5'-3' exonuclease domain-containing protein n=1 Tax=Biomphalaria glabrata TaxID=6526 RepID=A0A2C9KSE8_BIOGL
MVEPNKFSDLCDIISLYRPGPQDQVELYAKRKKDNEQIKLDNDVLEKILKPTLGIIIYQEQIMQIASSFANLTLAQADNLRRGMSKKDQNLILQQKELFINGAIKKGYSETEANRIFDLIEKFAGYGFNKSHAVAYALLGYYLAYLKANYSEEFYTCLLSNNLGDYKKLSEYMREINSSSNVKVETFRSMSYENYKAKRKPMPEDLVAQLEPIREYLNLRKFSSYAKEKYEADDVIATIATRAIQEDPNIRVKILTSDKDMLQLVNDNISILRITSGFKNFDEFNIYNFEKKTKLLPSQIIDLKIMLGDKSDNYPGRPGSGKTTLLKTIEGRYAAKVHVIYADDIVKNTLYVEHHPCFSQLVSNFGEKVIAKENKDNKTIDRKVLLNIIFDNKEQQMKLQKIVWPFLRREISKQLISDKRPIKLVELGAYLNSDGEFDDLFDEVILIHRNDSSIYDTLREKNH